jgi:hypothetical protein
MFSFLASENLKIWIQLVILGITFASDAWVASFWSRSFQAAMTVVSFLVKSALILGLLIGPNAWYLAVRMCISSSFQANIS